MALSYFKKINNYSLVSDIGFKFLSHEMLYIYFYFYILK